MGTTRTTGRLRHRAGGAAPFLRRPGAPGAEPDQVVPVAFTGRTSTLKVQDPAASLRRQARRCQAKLPPGWVITAWYWDIESGAMDIEQRGHGTAHEQFGDIGIPRDGGFADLLAEARSPDPKFLAVICEDIERSGRDTFYALKLEKELTRAGILLFATDERIDIEGANATTVLVRRVKQGVAEWYRLQLKEKAWAGFAEHAIEGWNIGKPPYGYRAGKVPHPNPAKRAEGRTKTRLALDPGRAPVIADIFSWRVAERLTYGQIAERLNADPHRYPPPRARNAAGVWTPAGVKGILANPKYTGHMVWNRTSGGRHNLPDAWVWSPEPAHPPIITREVFGAAQRPGGRERSRAGHGPSAHPATKQAYTLRGYMRCGICGRRLTGASRKNKNPITYYQCGLDTRDPRTASRYPGHPKAVMVREDAILATISEFFTTYIFGPGRAAHLAQVMPKAATHATAEREQQRTVLERELTRISRAQDNLISELETLPGDADDTTAAAFRTRIRARFAELERRRQQATTELAALTHDPEPADDPALLDELPELGDWLTEAPATTQQQLYDAFDLHIAYNRLDHTATITATLTSTTPGQIRDITSAGTPGGGPGHSKPSGQPENIYHLPARPITALTGQRS